jgi:hypothetical protein
VCAGHAVIGVLHTAGASHTHEEGAVVTCRPVDVCVRAHTVSPMHSAHFVGVKKKYRTEYSVTSHRQHYTCPPFPTTARGRYLRIASKEKAQLRRTGKVCVCVLGPLQNWKLTRKLTCVPLCPIFSVLTLITAVTVTATVLRSGFGLGSESSDGSGPSGRLED